MNECERGVTEVVSTLVRVVRLPATDQTDGGFTDWWTDVWVRGFCSWLACWVFSN
jgi:hypothetical protein